MPLPKSFADSTSVPGVLTVGSSCQDRVVYFHAEAADCYGIHHDSDGCEVIIEVTEEVVGQCISDRTTRNSTVAVKSFVPVLGTYDITVNATIYARCVSEFRIGTVMKQQLKKIILDSFTDRKTTGQRCIGSGAACLVDQENRFDGVSGISVDFKETMNQTVDLPHFCDPDSMYAPVERDEINRRTPQSSQVIKDGPGLRARPSSTLLSPKAYEMWGAFQNASHQASKGIQNSARRRMEAIGEYALDWHDYMQNGADEAGVMRAAYHGETSPTTATTNRAHIARRERRQLQQQQHREEREERRRLSSSSGVSDSNAAAAAAAESIVIGSYADSEMPFAKPHLYSAVSLTFTVRNVRAANKMWANALVTDILGVQEIPKDNARPKYVVNETSPWWEQDNNQNIYDGVYDLPRFTETPCSVAENMARVLKSTNSMRMRPTFRWTSIQLIIENTKDTYVDCGFSPVEIFFIVVGALLGFVLLCSLIFNVGCRRRGACGGDSDASFGSCYGGLDCCSMLTSPLNMLFCCCTFCPCRIDGEKTKRKKTTAAKKSSPDTATSSAQSPTTSTSNNIQAPTSAQPTTQPTPRAERKASLNNKTTKTPEKSNQSSVSSAEIAMTSMSTSEKYEKPKVKPGGPKARRDSKSRKSMTNPARASVVGLGSADAAADEDITIHTQPETGKRYTFNKKTKETKWID